MTHGTYALLCFIGGALLGLFSTWSMYTLEKHWRKWEMRRADGLELRLKQLAERLKEKA